MRKAPQIAEELCAWLKQAHFVNYCFISYPRVDPRVDDDLRDFANRIGTRLIAELEHLGAESLLDRDTGDNLPEVFMDHRIPPGADWPDDLRRNLGGSVCMVAVLTPSYFRRAHEWCGKEWWAMSTLGAARLRNTSTKPIIPVQYRLTDIPLTAGYAQSIDLSSLTTSSRYYYKEPEFTNAILDICYQIIQIATELRTNNSACDLNGLVFPQRSPFVAPAPGLAQAPPLRAA